MTHLKYADHHQYSADDIKHIHQKFDTFAEDYKIIITTEKDYMRLDGLIDEENLKYPWHYQPIEVIIAEDEKIKKIVDDYVR